MPPTEDSPPDVVSAGYLLFRADPGNPGNARGDAAAPPLQFLLMQHADRWDLPKGHVDAGESVEQAAARELLEETGVAAAELWTDPAFRFDYRYDIQRRGQARRKLLVVYLGWLRRDRPLRLTEHIGYRWLPWPPPHAIQARTIDPLLAAAAEHLAANPGWPGEGATS